MRRSPKSITIQDVARAAGVSVSTVSRVLNGKDDVAEETMEKVRSLVQELGYASSLAARGMRSHRTNVIGMIFPDIASPYCHEIMRGVNRAISQLDEDLIIFTSGGGRKENVAHHERSYVGLLNGGTADGVIVVTPTATTFSSHAPVVILDPNNESPSVPAVIATNREGALSAMHYLTGLGHCRIGHITGRMELVSSSQRLQGYKDGLLSAGLPYREEYVEIGDYLEETAYRCAQKLLTLQDRPTAIFAANDSSAMGVYRAAAKAGLRIPEDLSVIGFDNLRESTFTNPALTTVNQFLEEMGSIAIEMIEQLITTGDLPCNLHIMQTQLIIRSSCSAPSLS